MTTSDAIKHVIAAYDAHDRAFSEYERVTQLQRDAYALTQKAFNLLTDARVELDACLQREAGIVSTTDDVVLQFAQERMH